jgi:2'-5' RNA ligase
MTTAPDHRLFFALYPDPASALRIAALATRLRTELGLKGRPHELQRLHVTLHHLGDFVGMPERERGAAEAAAQSLQAEPIALRFDHLLSFERKRASNRPLVLGGGLGLDGVREFRRRLGEALKAQGLKVESSYTPHLTLLYDDRLVPKQPIEPLGWTAGEFVLVDSLLGQGRHVPLARWPLRAATQP